VFLFGREKKTTTSKSIYLKFIKPSVLIMNTGSPAQDQ